MLKEREREKEGEIDAADKSSGRVHAIMLAMARGERCCALRRFVPCFFAFTKSIMLLLR